MRRKITLVALLLAGCNQEPTKSDIASASAAANLQVTKCSAVHLHHYLEYSVATYSDGSSMTSCLISQTVDSSRSNSAVHTKDGALSSHNSCVVTYDENSDNAYETLTFTTQGGVASVVYTGTNIDPAFVYTFTGSECQEEL